MEDSGQASTGGSDETERSSMLQRPNPQLHHAEPVFNILDSQSGFFKYLSHFLPVELGNVVIVRID